MFEKTIDVESYEDSIETRLYANKIKIAQCDLALRNLDKKMRGMIA